MSETWNETPLFNTKIDTRLLPIANRIAQYLSPEEVAEMFTTQYDEPAVQIFPYCRVDDTVRGAATFAYLSKNDPDNYTKASEYAFKALVWIYIGFDGFRILQKAIVLSIVRDILAIKDLEKNGNPS